MVKEIERIAGDINSEGTSTLLVEQNAWLALTLTTKDYVLEMGSIVLSGDAQDLLQSDHVRRALLGV
jgi:branched-chain amino acid transport system ATP-binding protein